MKKYLLYILLILLSFKSFAQPIVHRTNGSITVSDERWRAGLNAFMPQFRDTASASAERGIDSAGAIIYTMLDHNIWLRTVWPKHWVLISTGENPIIPTWQQTLNTTNGSLLTKKDTINLNSHDFLIQDGSVNIFKIFALGGSSIIYGTDASFGNGAVSIGGSPLETTIEFIPLSGGLIDIKAPFLEGHSEELDLPNIASYLGNDQFGTLATRVNHTVADHSGTVVLGLVDSIWRTDRDSIHFRQWEPSGGFVLKAILDQTSNITGLITAGTNVTITGTGTAADPYIINSSGGGGGGSPNVNIGAGFRLAQVFTNNIKTLGGGVGILLDSTTTTNVITFKVDTVTMSTRGRLYKVADSVSKLVTLQKAIINGATLSQDNTIEADNNNFFINDISAFDLLDHAGVERISFNSAQTSIFGPDGLGSTSQQINMNVDSFSLISENLVSAWRNSQIVIKPDSIILRPYSGQLNIDSLRTAANLTGHRVLVWNYFHGNVESISVDSLRGSSSGFYDFPVRNGLQVIDGGADVDTLLLGGTLTQNTTLDANSLYSFRIDSTTTFQVTKRSDEDFGVGQILLDDNFGWIKYTNNIHTTTGIITATEEAASISASAPGVTSSMSVDAGYAEISATDSFTIKNNHVAIRYLPKSVDTATYKIAGINPLSGRLVYLPWLGGGGGGGSFINNGTTQQTSANWNIDGTGKAAGQIYVGDNATTSSLGGSVVVANSGNISRIQIRSFSDVYYTDLMNNAGGNGDFYLDVNGNSTAAQKFRIRFNGSDFFNFQGNGEFTIYTAPTTSAGTYDVLSRNTSTGIVEKITSATFIKQGSNTLSTNFTIDGASSTYTVTLSNILGLLVTSSSGNIQQGATNTLQANTGANFILGGAVISRALKTSNATLTINDHYIAVDATSGNITLTMPTNAAMGGATYSYVIKRIDNSGNTVTINAASSQTLDGAGSTTLASLQSKTLNFDGTNNFEIN